MAQYFRQILILSYVFCLQGSNAIFTELTCNSTFIDDNGNKQCMIKCNDTNDCNGNYLQQANYIDCTDPDRYHNCEGALIFCPDGDCVVNCQMENSCKDAVITGNSTDSIVLDCAGDHSCTFLQIKAPNVENITINCLGHASCKYATIMANFSQNVIINCNGGEACDNVLVEATDALFISATASNGALNSALIRATNSNELSFVCSGGYTDAMQTCMSSALWVPRETWMECIGPYSCVDLSIYSHSTNNSITALMDTCELCAGDNNLLCSSMDFYCGDNYSGYSQFRAGKCLDNACACCDETMFLFEDDYDECFVLDVAPNSPLFLCGVVIAVFSVIMMIFVTIKLSSYYRLTGKYRLYNLTATPPAFFVVYIAMIECMVFVTSVYILIAFAKSINDLNTYCGSKYPYSSDAMQALCDDDYYCSALEGGEAISPTDGMSMTCVYNQTFAGFSILFFVFFSIFCLSEGCRLVRCVNNIARNAKQNKSFIAKLTTIAIGGHNTNIQFCLFTVTRIIALFGPAIIGDVFVDGHAWFVSYALYLVAAALIIAQILKVYYKTLEEYVGNNHVKFMVLDSFGRDVGGVILQYVYEYQLIRLPKTIEFI